MRKKRIKATAAATVLVAAGISYYVVHQQQIAACQPTVEQVDALWAQSAAVLNRDATPPPGMSDPAFEAQMAQIQSDSDSAERVGKQAAAIVVAHPTCFSSYDVSNAKQWFQHR